MAPIKKEAPPHTTKSRHSRAKARNSCPPMRRPSRATRSSSSSSTASSASSSMPPSCLTSITPTSTSSSSISSVPPPNTPPATVERVLPACFLKLLVDDIDPSASVGYIVPFLSTACMARLSTCCKALQPYRDRIQNITVPSATRMVPAAEKSFRRALHALLKSKNRKVGMGFTFRDDEERWFKVLMRWLGEEQEGTEHIRSLAFACDGPRASSVRATVSTLATIDFPNLEELNVRLPSRGDDPKSNQEPANPMMEALIARPPPRLRRITFKRGIGDLQNVMRQGRLSQLREVTFDHLDGMTEGGNLSEALTAIAGGCCPKLQRLSVLGRNGLGTEHVRCCSQLGEAIGRRACLPHLEELALDSMDAACTVPLLVSMVVDAKQFPNHQNGIKRLYLERLALDKNHASRLAPVLASGQFSKLERLHMAGCLNRDKEAAHIVLQAFATTQWPRLIYLNLKGTKWTKQASLALAEAFNHQSCPKLEMLVLEGTPGDELDSIVSVLEALAGGGCPNLKRLSLKWMKLLADGGAALAAALASQGLQHVEELCLDGISGMKRQGLNQIVAAMTTGGGCPNLVSLSAEGIGLVKNHYDAIITQAAEGHRLPRLWSLNSKIIRRAPRMEGEKPPSSPNVFIFPGESAFLTNT